MEKFFFLVSLKWCLVFSKESLPFKENNQDLQPLNSGKVLYDYDVAPVIQVPDVYNTNHQLLQNYGYISSSFPLLLPQSQLKKIVQSRFPELGLHVVIDGNPLSAALLLGASLGLHSKTAVPNHPELPPINPYVALLLSHYGRYLPIHGTAKGLYGYAASNNFHNNKPFGSYKVYEDTK